MTQRPKPGNSRSSITGLWRLRIDSRGRMTLPKALLEELHWKSGDTLSWELDAEGRLTLLPQGKAERFTRVVKVLSMAKEIFGSLEKARSWMGKPNGALGGVTPKSLLETEPGAKAVADVLTRIEHGVFS